MSNSQHEKPPASTTQATLPTTVVNGFLGSGKTTIISHLIDELIKQGQKVVYVKNEIGDVDLDAQLMRGKNIIAQELLNGCICCTLIGPFLASINELVATYKPDRIIIESAGSADPASLALMVENHPLLRRDGVVSVIDVVNFNGYDQINHISQRQTEFTDLIIFNKIELVDEQRKQQVVGYVREINSRAPIVEAKHGRISAELVFGLDTGFLTGFETEPKERHLGSDSHDQDHEHDHEAHDEINAFTYQSSGKIDKQQLQKLLSNLPKNIFRVKGYFQDQNRRWLVNHVFERTDFSLLTTDPSSDSEITTDRSSTKLIFIGYQAQTNQDQIVKDLKKL